MDFLGFKDLLRQELSLRGRLSGNRAIKTGLLAIKLTQRTVTFASIMFQLMRGTTSSVAM